MEIFLQNLPVVFAVVGLVLFFIGQFLKGRDKIFFTISGLLLVGFFIFKLLMLKVESPIVQGQLRTSNVHSIFFSILFIIISLNILGLILWLISFLKVVFLTSIFSKSQTRVLLSGAIIMVVALLIYFLLGSLIGAICFPIMTIGYFIAVKNYYWKLKAE